MQIKNDYLEIDLKDDLGLTDSEILILLQMAHEKNMTLEELIIKILDDFIKDIEINSGGVKI